MDIRGKVAVVTGAASGIGRATALRLVREGAAVVVADRDAAGSAATVAEAGRDGGAAAAVTVDLGDPSQVHRVFDAALSRFGGVDILHNNAGITTGVPAYPEAPAEQWQRVIDVNLRAVVLATQLALPLLRQRGGGAVIHTASMAALVGFPPDPIYTATKAAVLMFTHSLAPLAAEGIRVNCVCPGLVDTPLLRQGQGAERPAWLDSSRMLQPEDVADAVVALLTDDSIAGRALRVLPGTRDLAPLPPYAPASR